jgi:hypothetical protein
VSKYSETASKGRVRHAADERMEFDSSRIIISVRTGGAFLLNLAVATVGVGILESPYIRYVHFSPLSRASILRGDLLTAAVAFGIGYSVYARWQPIAAKWIWLAGLCWLGLLALLVLEGSNGTIWEISETRTRADFESFANWTGYTFPGLRTIFYSGGAFCRSRRSKRALLGRSSAPIPEHHGNGGQ